MSYTRPNTGDPELDRQLAHEDFVMLLPRLQAADTDLGFAVWLDKLALIERDAIIAYLREHWEFIININKHPDAPAPAQQPWCSIRRVTVSSIILTDKYDPRLNKI